MLEKSKPAILRCGYLLISTLLITTIPLVPGTERVRSEAIQKPPVTRQDSTEEIIHGVKVVDSYRWLENQESQETRAWIDTQNDYAHSLIDSLPGRERLARRLTELMKIDRIGMPIKRGKRYFMMKRTADQELPVIIMREGLEGADQVLIDPHPMSADYSTSVSLWDVSKDGRLLIYGIRQGGEDEAVVKFFDIDSRSHLADEFPKARYFGMALTPDNKTLYYSHHTDEGSRVFKHVMGTDPSDDVQIFGEEYGPEQGIGVDVSEEGHYLLVGVFLGWDKSEVYIKDLLTDGPIEPLITGIDANFDAQFAGDKLFVMTNWKASNGRLFVVDLKNPGSDFWRDVIPETDAVIEGFTLAGGKLFVNYLENVVSKVKVYESNGSHVRDISFPTLGTVSGVYGRWQDNEAFFLYTSFHVPNTIYHYDVATGRQKEWAKLDVRINSEIFEVKQVWFESKDGTKVPMFIVHTKGLELNGSNPTLLTGYGGFNGSMTPYFSASAVLFVENGGVFAMPNLRGGGEFGEKWHKEGMLENKQNVFDDFMAAAEWLIDNGYTKSTKLAILGGSNGGLLVGAALTQRPDLFQAVVCTYPLLDMIRYHHFLLGKLWISEFGSSDDPDQFKYLLKYSPYHNVSKGTNYPAVLFITGDADTRVDPMHARKMTALLQSATASEKPVILLYDTKSGHSGGRPLSKDIEDTTDEMIFLFWQLGMANMKEY